MFPRWLLIIFRAISVLLYGLMSYDTTWEMLICSFLKKHGSSGHEEFPSYLQRFFSDSTLIWDYCAGGGIVGPLNPLL